MDEETQAPVTETKTKSITNTKLAIATAFLGFAALAAAAGGMGGGKSCVGSGTVTADPTQQYVEVCTGQTIAYKDTYGINVFFYVNGFGTNNSAVLPLYAPGDISVYAVGSQTVTMIHKGKTQTFNFPAGNGLVTHTLMYRGMNGKGVAYFAVGATGPTTPLTCESIDKEVLSGSLCYAMLGSKYACLNKYTGMMSGCAAAEDDFSGCESGGATNTNQNNNIICPVPLPTPVASCDDSDGGIDYYTKGTVTSNVTSSTTVYTEIKTDECSTGQFSLPVLHEFSCGEYGAVMQETYCESGCVDGACVTFSTLPVAELSVVQNSEIPNGMLSVGSNQLIGSYIFSAKGTEDACLTKLRLNINGFPSLSVLGDTIQLQAGEGDIFGEYALASFLSGDPNTINDFCISAGDSKTVNVLA
ncbi:MAG: hypothetical protein COV60_00620, partial [Candidatus Magasanikbacteria bacterium CG11_big_fil_rev_8_21_14_0_20_43_7]